MNYNIVNESASDIRAIARNALQNNWFKVFTGLLVYSVLIVLIPGILESIPVLNQTVTYGETFDYGKDITFSYASSLYMFLLSGPFSVGLCSFMIAFFRKKDINSGYIFNGFEYFLKSFALMFMVGLFTLLWTLLFVVPGIIAAYRYSQAFYILADDPSKGVMQCIGESKIIMNGNKAKLFCTELSFIGWYILAAIPAGIAAGVIEGFNITGITATLISFIASFGTIVVLTYLSTALVAFYDLVTGNLVAQPKFNEADYYFDENITRNINENE